MPYLYCFLRLTLKLFSLLSQSSLPSESLKSSQLSPTSQVVRHSTTNLGDVMRTSATSGGEMMRAEISKHLCAISHYFSLFTVAIEHRTTAYRGALAVVLKVAIGNLGNDLYLR